MCSDVIQREVVKRALASNYNYFLSSVLTGWWRRLQLSEKFCDLNSNLRAHKTGSHQHELQNIQTFKILGSAYMFEKLPTLLNAPNRICTCQDINQNGSQDNFSSFTFTCKQYARALQDIPRYVLQYSRKFRTNHTYMLLLLCLLTDWVPQSTN